MDYQFLLNEQRSAFKELSKNFLKEDFNFLTNKQGFNQKRIGVFTRNYYKRKKLVQLGTLTYGYVLRIRDNGSQTNPISTWVLFSPSNEYEKNPAKYEKTLQNIDKILNSPNINKKYKRLKIMLTESLAEPVYFPVPDELSDGDVVYISHVYYWRTKNPNMRPGLMPIFISQNISKEILYLPERYWTDNFIKLLSL